MPLIEPDLSEVSNFEPMEAGTYPGRCVSAVPDKSKAGNSMVVIESEIDYNGETRKKKDWLVTSGKGAYKLENFLRAVGMDEEADALKAGTKMPIDTDVFLGATYHVVVEPAVYNDAPTDQIKTYLKA